MATDAELLALIGRAPSQQQQFTAGETLPELDLTAFLSPAAQRELEAARALKGEPRFPSKTASVEGPPVLDPVVTSEVVVAALLADRLYYPQSPRTIFAAKGPKPFGDFNNNDGFTFSGQEDGYVDSMIASELAEPPPPPPVDMASFNLEDLWSKDATDEIDDGIGGGRGAPPPMPTRGLEAIFMNREAQEAQEALGLLGSLPPLPPVSRQSRDMEISFDSGGDFDFNTSGGAGSWGGGGGRSSGGVVVGSRGADGRFHSVPVPRPRPRPEVRTASVDRPSRSDVSRREVYQPPPPRPIEACTSRLAFISGDD